MAQMSPLRRRMIEDLTVRNLSPTTQRVYLHAVRKLSRHFGCSPDRLDLEKVRAFQVYLTSTGLSWPALNRWKDYRHHGKAKIMALDADEFMRRFLLHTLPDGFHRIRQYGFLANRQRAEKLALCRKLLEAASSQSPPAIEPAAPLSPDPCPCCGGLMIRLGTLPRFLPSRSCFGYDSS